MYLALSTTKVLTWDTFKHLCTDHSLCFIHLSENHSVVHVFQGLLREDDLGLFDEDFQKNFKAHPPDAFSEDGWEEDWMSMSFDVCLLFATRGQCSFSEKMLWVLVTKNSVLLSFLIIWQIYLWCNENTVWRCMFLLSLRFITFNKIGWKQMIFQMIFKMWNACGSDFYSSFEI